MLDSLYKEPAENGYHLEEIRAKTKKAPKTLYSSFYVAVTQQFFSSFGIVFFSIKDNQNQNANEINFAQKWDTLMLY